MALQGFIETVAAQTAVYWGNPTPDGYGGVNYDDPVEVKVRWDNVNKVMTDAKGKEFVCRAEILVAGQLDDDETVTIIDLDEDGRIYLGTLDDIDSGDLDNPIAIDGAWVIRRSDKVPEFGSTTEFVRTVFL